MKKILLFCSIILLFESSCNKFLDKKNDDSVAVPTTLSDLQALMDNQKIMNRRRTPSMGICKSDEYYLSDEKFNSLDVTRQADYLWDQYNYDPGSNDWGQCYAPIYYTNITLEQLSKIKRNKTNFESWDIVKGSALFYRSYYFSWLLWNYAKSYDVKTAKSDLGIVLRLTSDFNIKSTRSSNDQSYSQLINDTKTAISLLPKYAQAPSRPTKAAAYGLLARCYLSMRNYNNALLYADSALQINNQLINYNTDTEDIVGGIESKSPFKMFNKETIFYSEINSMHGLFRTSAYGSMDTSLIKMYAQNDLRLKAFYYDNSHGGLAFKGWYTGDVNTTFSGIATDEMYLIRAEGYARNGQLIDAQNDLNHLLINRYATNTYLPLKANSKDQILNAILEERRKELVMRGQRWMDIKRLNMEGAGITLKRVIEGKEYLLLPNSNFYALPIPHDIIDITGMPQNPK